MNFLSTITFEKMTLGIKAKTILLFIAFLSLSTGNAQTIRYVKQGGTGNGSSWASASGDLQAMVNASASGDQVWVTAGDYQRASGQYFSLKEGVKIYGGFPAAGNPSMGSRDWTANSTRMLGNGGRVVYCDQALTSASILDGFTITNGSSSIGGGVYLNIGSPMLSNLVVKFNTSNEGAGMFIGGGSAASLNNVTLSDNIAVGNGAGIFILSCSPLLTNVVVKNNTGKFGAGIMCIAASPILTNIKVMDNTGTSGAGICAQTNSNLAIVNGLVAKNTGTISGGIFAIDFSTVTLTNLTIADNIAENEGAGLYVGNSTVRLRNCIVWGNKEVDGTLSQIANTGSPSYFNSIIQGSGGYASWNTAIGINGGNNMDVDPLFINTATSNYAFQALSPAFNTGNNIYFTNASTSQDIIGNPRLFGNNIDMGAYETQTAPTVMIRYVRQSGVGNGYSWGGASGDLQAMINESSATNQVWVAAGEYQRASGQYFSMKEGVKIYGGFPNSGNPVLTNRNWASNQTLLKGNGSNVIVNSNNALTNAALLDGFTISNGNAPGNGGGINNVNAYPTITNSIIRNNTAGNWGGGIYNEGNGTALITNCLFYGNTAGGGGAVFNNLSNASKFINCTFSGNNAGINGAALHNLNLAATPLQNCIFWGNTSASGFQIFSSAAGSTVVSNCIVQGGSAGISGTSTNNNLIDGDPLFTSPALGNYSVASLSPAVNTGNSAYFAGLATAKDLAAFPRSFGGTIDIGAYESQVIPVVTIRYVRPGALGNGYTWAGASGDLKAMINASSATNQVWVAAGEYQPLSGQAFTMKEAVKIYGGFPTTGNPGMINRNWSANTTILKGNGYRVIENISNGLTPAAILDGFTVTGGNTVGSGAGILNQTASPTLSNLIISNNTATSTGGGIYNSFSSQPLVSNCIISNNSAHRGGGISNQTSSPSFFNVTIKGNAASNSGGGMFNNSDCFPILSDVIIENNTAMSDGGGLCNSASSPVLTNVRIRYNTATGSGGGVCNLAGSATTINNSVLCNNMANYGGGIYNSTSSPISINITIANNTAATNGAGIINAISSFPQFRNTIIWGNKKTDNSINSVSNTTASVPVYSNSIIENSGAGTAWISSFGTDAGGNINMDPLFVDAVNSNFSLTNCSIAINAGNNSYVGSALTDLAGNTRISDSAVDIGAYEFQGPANCNICAYTAKWNGSSWNIPPTARTILEFNGNYTSTGNITGCSIKVNSGNVLIKNGNTITVTRAVDATAGTFTLENNASLVQFEDTAVNTGVNFSMKRNTKPMYRYDYTYWSSPVAGQTLYNLSPATQPDKYYGWDTTNQNWTGYNNGNHVMSAGKGYIVRAPNSFSGNPSIKTVYTAIFNGTPNNGLISPTVVGSAGYNFLGNPYPSAISADAFLSANSASLDGTLYFWTHNTPIAAGGTGAIYTADDYASYNLLGGAGTSPSQSTGINNSMPSGFITAGEGFFIKGRNSGGQAIFNNSMRVTGNNSQFFRSADQHAQNEIEKHRFWLNISDGSAGFRQVLIGYAEGATNQLDWGFDGELNSANNLLLYSLSDEKMLAIQGRQLPFDQNDIVPLGFKANISGSYLISLDHFDGVFESHDIYLKDNLLNITHDLKAAPYSFLTEAGTSDERFEIVYTATPLNIADYDFKNNVVIFNNKGTLQIVSGQHEMESVKVFDIAGRLIYQTDINNTEITLDDLVPANQILLFRVKMDNGDVIINKTIY